MHKLEGFSLPILLRFKLFTMQNTELIRKTLIRYGMTQYKLLNRSEGFFYSVALYDLFTCCTSYQTSQTDFYPLALLRLAARAIKQARRVSSGTFTTCCTSYWTDQSGFLWHFYDLLDCETPNKSNGLPAFDTWRLSHLQSAWIRWWLRSWTTFSLHALFDLQAS